MLTIRPLVRSLALLSLASAPFAQEPAPAAEVAPTRLLRFPDVHGGRVVFCHGGDLWSASVEGGLARRLTAHPGLELFPKF